MKIEGIYRREALRGLGVVGSFMFVGGLLRNANGALAGKVKQNRLMGVCSASYGARRGNGVVGFEKFDGAMGMMDHCYSIGSAGVQIGVRGWEGAMAGKVRARREEYGMYLEGQIGLPKTKGDVGRFEGEVKGAVEAGATILRTAMLGGRRYETFDSAEAFEAFRKKAWASLVLAEPIARKHGVEIAVENHKDWRVEDLVGMMERIDSEFVGITVDTGNSVSLLEDPMEVVEAYAPWGKSVHLKDMGVREYEDGFLLSEVALGDGFLDLGKMVEVLLKANPEIKFSLEMITRDPLKVPCLTEKYWKTFGGVGGVELGKALKRVRANASVKELPSVTGKSLGERLRYEEENVVRSFEYTRQEFDW